MLEMRTRRQHQCDEWYIERKKRLVPITYQRRSKICFVVGGGEI